MNVYRKKQRRHLKPYAVALLIIIAAAVAIPVLLFCKNRYPAAARPGGVTSPVAVAKSDGASKAPSSLKPESSAVHPIQVSFQNAAKPLWIDVSIAKQVVTVYDADNRVVESWLCSTGSPGHDTPKGTFHVYNRGKSFYSKKYQEGGYYWVAFYEDYYFHSVPFDKNRQIIQSIANDLGHQDSHGCVHLSIPNSEWIYKNVSNGTKVVIE